MARTKISEFSSTPANNTDIDSINIAEGCAPSGINDAIRELMSQLKDWQSGTSNDPYVVGSSGSLTLSGGTANGVAYLNGSKVVTSGSALTFDGSVLATSVSGATALTMTSSASQSYINLRSVATAGYEPFIGFGDSSAGNIGQMLGINGGGLRWTTGGSEQMRLTSTGLGIGTSSPTQKLDVNGNIRTSGEVALSGSDFVYSWAGGTTGQRRSGFYLDGTNNVLRFYTNQSEVGRFDSSGNLGLGVTPSASPNCKNLELPNGSTLSARTAAPQFAIMNNAVGDWYAPTYKTTAVATMYLLASGQHNWYNAPSGTAGDAITFTQAATITAGGDFLVGTTTSAARLTVQGVDATASNYAVRINNSAGTDVFRVRNDGYFITGSATQSPYNLTTGSAANVNIDGNGGLQRVTSSLKYKRDVQNSSHGLNELLTLRSVTYKGKGANDGETVFGGLIAEEVHAAGLTEFVQYAPDGTPDALAYGQMVSLCIKAIQELKAEFDAYKASHP